MFFVNLGFDVLGVYAGNYMKVGEQLAFSMFTTWTWGTVTSAIFTNIWEFLDTVLSVLWFVITNIIPNLSWEDGIIAGLHEAMAATGAGLIADLAGLGIGAGVGLMNLGMENCL